MQQNLVTQIMNAAATLMETAVRQHASENLKDAERFAAECAQGNFIPFVAVEIGAEKVIRCGYRILGTGEVVIVAVMPVVATAAGNSKLN